MTRRQLLGLVLGGLASCSLPSLGAAQRRRWIDTFPCVIQTSDPELLETNGAQVLMCNIAADPTWGPYAQRLSVLETRELVRRLRGRSVRTITYIEGVGDCMVYAVAFARRSDGTLETFPDDPVTARPVRTHWCWVAENLPPGDTVGWAGIQASVLDEAFVRPAYTLEARRIPFPKYPDGRPARGRVGGWQPPLDAAIWDACASKDLNGRLRPIFAPVVGLDPGEAPPERYRQGLYPAIAGTDDIEGADVPPGTTVWCGLISVHKDLSAPFWREYARVSAQEIARAGLDGVWCDNWSPWDNFGYPPIKHAFGDWSVHRLKEYVARKAPKRALISAGISDPAALDIGCALKERAGRYGVRDSSDLADQAWSDHRWVNDPVWRLFKAGRQVNAREDLRALYRALHQGAREGGSRDFAVCCNDIPLYGLGWAREPWTDMVHTEVTPGWHMGSGTRGIMLPPEGKMAVVYRAALAHQSGRFCAAWYYLDGPHSQYRGREGLARVLLAEALANGAVLLCYPDQARVAGSVETHAWLNRYVRANQSLYTDRVPVADTALVFSPDCQLYELAPGGFPDMDNQPHVFGHWGWGTALLDAHCPYMVLPDWRLTARDLRAFRKLILPDVACLSDSAIRAIAGWVRAGGHLITTGPCATRHGTDGAYLDRTRDLHEVLGVRPENAWATHRVSRGSVSCIAGSVGMTYYLERERRPMLLADLRRAVGGSLLLPEVMAPPTVEIGIWRQTGRQGLAVDLANTNVDLSTDEVREVDTVMCSVRVPWSGPSRATLKTPDHGTTLRARSGAGQTVLTVERLKHYACVYVEPDV